MSSKNVDYESNGNIWNATDTVVSTTQDVDKAIPASREIDQSHQRRVWLSISVSCICYVISYFSQTPLEIQYLYHRIARDDFDFAYNSSDIVGSCRNASGFLKHQMNLVQKEASNFIIGSSLISGIPALFTCLLVGSYSDYIGRKPILLAAMLGGVIRFVIFTLIVKFDWAIRLYYIGAAVDGISGSFLTLLLATTAIIADVTPDGKNRALNFAVVEGLVFPTAAAAQIGIGYMIRDGYLYPSVLLSGFVIMALLVNFFFLPETVHRKRAVSWDPRIHIKKVFGFYFIKTSNRKRTLYILALVCFSLGAVTNSGKSSVEMLFQLAYPLCLESVEIGEYSAVRIVGAALITIVFMKVMKTRISIEYTGVVCAISGVAGFILFGLSRTSLQLYLAALVGMFYYGCGPIARGLLSQLTPATEQGAMFSSLSFVNALSSLVAPTMLMAIYNATLESFKGAVFIIVAGFTLINAIFLVGFRYVRAGSIPSDYTTLVDGEQVDEERTSQTGAPAVHSTSRSHPNADESSKLLRSN